MAKSTTSTKAKTKTTKKPAAKAKTVAAKTSRATKSTKVTRPAAKAAVKNNGRAVVTSASLRKLHFIKAFVTAALAIAAGALMNNTAYAMTLGYQAKDELLSLTAGKTAFVHASQSVLDVQVRWMVVIILGLSALFSLLAATRMRRKYETALATNVSPMRWVGIGITSALIVETIALLTGVSDIVTLKLLAGLVLATSALGWVIEKRVKQAGRPIWSEFAISVFTGILPWILIGSYALSTWVYGLVRYPWFVYALIASTIVGFTLLAVNQYKHVSGWKDYPVIDRNYILIATATHAAFAVILILAFQK